jgi:hypothetical protein
VCDFGLERKEKSEPELEVVDMVADFVNGGMRKESKEEARGPRGRADMAEDPAVSLTEEVGLVVMRVSLEGKSRAVVGMVEWFVIGNVVLETMMSHSY